MRAGRVALVVGLVAVGTVPAWAWMTYVPRDVGTGERLGRGASIANEDDDTQLAIICLADGLTATFLTGIKLTSDRQPSDFPASLGLAEQGGEFEAFPVTQESMVRGDARELRLRFSAEEAMGLAEFVLNAPAGIALRYSADGEALVEVVYDSDSAAISIGAVLSECEGR